MSVALEEIGGKLDGQSPRSGSRSTPGMASASSSNPPHSRQYPTFDKLHEGSQTGARDSRRQAFNYLTVPHMVVLWPSIQDRLINSDSRLTHDLEGITQQGTKWFVRQELDKHPRSLLPAAGLTSVQVARLPDQGYSPRVTFPYLSVQQMVKDTDAYFSTFNVLNPILDYDEFMSDTVTTLVQEGFGEGDTASVLALLVFALGEVAIEGKSGEPISASHRAKSGFRGGDAQNPPGLATFNEARRRHGFIAAITSLENVQISFLQGIYYESTAHHLEYWNSISTACTKIQTIIKCHDFVWMSYEGDMISRMYWACLLGEDLYHLDLDFPTTGMRDLEDKVPLPSFNKVKDPLRHRYKLDDEPSYGEFQFLALITLRRMIVRIQSEIYECV